MNIWLCIMFHVRIDIFIMERSLVARGEDNWIKMRIKWVSETFYFIDSVALWERKNVFKGFRFAEEKNWGWGSNVVAQIFIAVRSYFYVWTDVETTDQNVQKVRINIECLRMKRLGGKARCSLPSKDAATILKEAFKRKSSGRWIFHWTNNQFHD